MAKCDYCGSSIIFGGKREGELRFCNDRCRSNGRILLLSRQVPDGVVRESAKKVHQGKCPKCQGPGPVDVHVTHRVWSALFLTSWRSIPQISCRSCGRKSQLGGAAFSLLLGWWGFPWGFIITPIQIGRNVFGMVTGPDPDQPSAQLEKAIRMNIVSNTLAAASAKPPGAATTGGAPS
jgi:hypothetical protein